MLALNICWKVFPRFAPGTRLIFTLTAVVVLSCCAIAGWRKHDLGVLASGGRESRFPTSSLSKQPSLHRSSRTDPRVSLSAGYALLNSYRGDEQLQQVLLQNLAAPRSLASADFDEDGVPDLVSGYAYDSRGIITVNRGNVDAIYPNAPAAKERRANGSFTDAPFLSPALIVPVSAAADFVGAGDFNADGHWDIVTASLGGHSLHFLAGDGAGNFAVEELVSIGGAVTAFATGEINRQDGLTDIVVGVDTQEGHRVFVFEGPGGALKSSPESFAFPASVTSLALGQFGDHYAFDVAAAAGNQIFMIEGRDRRLSLDETQQRGVLPARMSARTFNFQIKTLVAGNFSGDWRQDLAFGGDDNRVRLLIQSFTTLGDQPVARSLDGWSLETLNGDYAPAGLVAAHVSTSPWEDLIVLGAGSGRIDAISRFQIDDTSDKSTTITNSLEGESPPIAILPMRLDVDGLSDLVVLRSNSSAPALVRTVETSSYQIGPNTPAGIFSNPATVTIGNSGSTPIKASPYPSTITISGQTGNINRLRVALTNFSHNTIQNVDVLVVGPTGAGVVLLSDVMGNAGSLNLLFDDSAGANVAAPIVSGTFKPTDVSSFPSDSFPSPAPAGSFGTALSVFNGTNANGTWSLYVVDDSGIFGPGSIADGWSLIIDDPPPTTFDVINTNDAGAGSLRQAILDANGNPGADIITFHIPGSGAHTIMPASALPNITDPVTIDATTQPGFAGSPLIEIDGTNTGGFAGTFRGVLNITGGNSVVRGLVINRYNTDAIALLTNGNNIIEGNFIGTDLSGTLDRGNFCDGIAVDSPNNLIGGTTAAARNIVSGLAYAIVLAGAGQNLVQGNYIGTNVAGDAIIGNSHGGVSTRSVPGSPNNIVGGTTAGARNLISGGSSPSGVDFVYSGSNGCLVQGNYIGTDVTGTKAFASFGSNSGNNDGVDISGGAHDNTVGGTTPAARNIISGNFMGVEIIDSNTFANLVQGNFIGTNVNGNAVLENEFYGIFCFFDSNSNVIGGASASARNIISGNTVAGIRFGEPSRGGALNNLVQKNYIGTDVTGDLPVPNGRTAFFDGDAGIVIPANSRGDRIIENRIAYNKGAGIRITNVSGGDVNSIEIEIADNEIYGNEGLGIDLGGKGITPNDPLDADDGPNRLQNFPELNSATAIPSFDGSTDPATESGRPDLIGTDALTVNGTLKSAPTTTYTVHWYFSADPQCTTNQAATRPLVTGKVPGVTTNANGDAQFSFPFDFPDGVNSGIINCTATDQVGNTSEFSACLQVASAAPQQPVVQFSATTYSTAENIGSKSINVTRGGNTSPAVSVDYTTSDTAGANPCSQVAGFASSRCDYEATLGKLKFAAGETSKTILIPIVDDAYAEGNENFSLTFSNPIGCTIGGSPTATITINDNESTNGPNPISDPSFFTKLHYYDFLGREADTAGLNFWRDQITSCGSDNTCTEVRRINVSGSFFLSIEFQETGYLVERTYKVAYGDVERDSTFPAPAHKIKVPIIRFHEFLADTQQINEGVVVLQTGWEQKLESNKVAFFGDFVQRSRFTQALPTTMTPTQFVEQLNTTAGNVLSPSEKTTAINLFGGAGNSANLTARAQAVRKVAEDADLNAAEFNRAFVLMQYFGYLRRNPDDPQDVDYSGYEFWLIKLNQFGGNYINAEMVKAFLSSIEYNRRFGS